MNQLRPLVEWLLLIGTIVGYFQAYSESGQRRSPEYEIRQSINFSEMSSVYTQELKQAGLSPAFGVMVTPGNYCNAMYPTSTTNYRGALLAANCYVEKNDPRQALNFLNIAIQLDGTQVEPYYFRGVLYLSLNQYTQGRSSLQKALDVTADSLWESKIKRELLFSSINTWISLPFIVGSIIMVGLEIAKNLGLEIPSKTWAMMLIVTFVIWAVSFIFISIY